MTVPDEAVEVEPGCWECSKCDYPITFDGGLQVWVHWWNGSPACNKEAS